MPIDPNRNLEARAAVVRGARRPEEVEAYLPSNYWLERSYVGSDGRLAVIILGYDDAGWTMDDYVIPRLASGLMSCTTIDPQEV